MSLQEKVKETISRYGLIEPGEKVVVAVSGGPDSVALLHLLLGLKEEYALSLHVAHLNHMLRGKEAEEDAAFVAALAREWGVPATVASRDVRRFKAETKLSLQEAARKIRYAFLEEVAREVGAEKIALGHQANDQAETMLLYFLRGGGLEGLAGIPPRQGKFIRPLILASRAEIEDYCRAKGLPFRLDSSNQKKIYLRNRIRLELFPFLLRYNPALLAVLGRTAEILREENQYLEEEAAKAFLSVARREGKKIALGAALGELPVALQRRLVRLACRELLPEAPPLGFNQVERVRKLAAAAEGKKCTLPGGLVARKYRGEVWLFFPEPKSSPFFLPLQVPGETLLPTGKKISASFLSWEGQEKPLASPNEAYLDAAFLPFPLFVRSRQPGDRFWPLGAPGRKKLKDFFIDLKVPPEEREKIPLVVGGGEIVWVGGLRPSHLFRVTSETRKVLYLRLEDA